MAMAVEILNDNPLFSFIFFSCVDPTSGPVPKCLWRKSGDDSNLEETVKFLTPVLLKGEMNSDPNSSAIDVNYHSLTFVKLFTSTFMFGGRSNDKLRRRMYALSLAMDIEKDDNEDKYAKMRDVIEIYCRYHILIYRVLLDQDMERKDISKSNNYLMRMVADLTEWLQYCDSTQLKKPAEIDGPEEVVRLFEETFFGENQTENRMIETLVNVVNSMAFCFMRVIVIGDEKNKNKIVKWVRTLSLFVMENDASKCFLPVSTKDKPAAKIVPGAIIQGHIMSFQDLLSEENIITLHLSPYPSLIVEVCDDDVIITKSGSLHSHRVNMNQMLEAKVSNMYHNSLTSQEAFTKHIDEARKSFTPVNVKSLQDSKILTDLCRLLLGDQMGISAKQCYLERFKTYIWSAADAVAHFVHSRSGKVTFKDLKKYQFLKGADVSLILHLAETLIPGLSEDLTEVVTIEDLAAKLNNVLDGY